VKRLLLGGAMALVGLAGPVGAATLGGAAPASASTGGAAVSSALSHLGHQVTVGTGTALKLVNVPPLLGKHVLGRLKDSAAVESTNWAGWADIDETFTAVSSSWTEPAVYCTNSGSSSSGSLLGGLLGTGGGSGSDATSYSSFWDGLDGYTSSSVEQTGTAADCTSTGPSYYAWYEMYPAGETQLPASYKVEPNDVMVGTVNYSGGDFIMVLQDKTQNWTYTTNPLSGPSLARSSVEFVAEAPSSCDVLFCDGLPLADFGTVNFTNASVVDTSGLQGDIAQFPDAAIQMSSDGTVKATPDALNATNNGFSVTWSHS
jgi:hypothetical protein